MYPLSQQGHCQGQGETNPGEELTCGLQGDSVCAGKQFESWGPYLESTEVSNISEGCKEFSCLPFSCISHVGGLTCLRVKLFFADIGTHRGVCWDVYASGKGLYPARLNY